MAQLELDVYRRAIESLSAEPFDEFVGIPEKSYLGTDETVLDNGVNDSGADLILFPQKFRQGLSFTSCGIA